MKHRLFEYHVREKGFTALAIETNWPESDVLDRYIKTGEGDPVDALRSLYIWPWQAHFRRERLQQVTRGATADRAMNIATICARLARRSCGSRGRTPCGIRRCSTCGRTRLSTTSGAIDASRSC